MSTFPALSFICNIYFLITAAPKNVVILCPREFCGNGQLVEGEKIYFLLNWNPLEQMKLFFSCNKDRNFTTYSGVHNNISKVVHTTIKVT